MTFTRQSFNSFLSISLAYVAFPLSDVNSLVSQGKKNQKEKKVHDLRLAAAILVCEDNTQVFHPFPP